MTTSANPRDRFTILLLRQLSAVLLFITGTLSVALGDLAKAIASTSTGVMRFDVVGNYSRYIGMALLVAGLVRWLQCWLSSRASLDDSR